MKMKIKIKKRLLVVFSIVLSITLFRPVLAEETSSVVTFSNADYQYFYRQENASDGTIISSYIKARDDYEAKSSLQVQKDTIYSHNKIKSILKSLGMEEEFVECMSQEKLDLCLSSEEIVATTRYIASNEQGESRIVDESEAQAAENEARRNRESLRSIVPGDDNGGGSYPTYTTEYTDSYLKITFVVFKIDIGKYRYSVDTRWLTEPFVRSWDSIGICVDKNAILNNTISGWNGYTRYTNWGSGSSTEYVENTFTSSDYSFASNVNWNGAGAVFDLPNDSTGYGMGWTQIFYGFRAHFEFQSVMFDPEESTTIHPTATYSHAQSVLFSEPSVKLSASGSTYITVLDTTASVENRTVSFANGIAYTPGY